MDLAGSAAKVPGCGQSWPAFPRKRVRWAAGPGQIVAAEGAEAAAKQGKFWPMHDQLLDHQGALTASEVIRYAGEIGLDTERFTRDLRDHAGQAKIAAYVDSADLSGVSGTPTFFINGQRHHGAYDIGTLSGPVQAARSRAVISSRVQTPGSTQPARTPRHHSRCGISARYEERS